LDLLIDVAKLKKQKLLLEINEIKNRKNITAETTETNWLEL